jgi:hypothetical protein
MKSLLQFFPESDLKTYILSGNGEDFPVWDIQDTDFLQDSLFQSQICPFLYILCQVPKYPPELLDFTKFYK